VLHACVCSCHCGHHLVLPGLPGADTISLLPCAPCCAHLLLFQHASLSHVNRQAVLPAVITTTCCLVSYVCSCCC
jgi:hypothetical protein